MDGNKRNKRTKGQREKGAKGQRRKETGDRRQIKKVTGGQGGIKGGREASGDDRGGLLYSFVFKGAKLWVWDYSRYAEINRGKAGTGSWDTVWGN